MQDVIQYLNENKIRATTVGDFKRLLTRTPIQISKCDIWDIIIDHGQFCRTSSDGLYDEYRVGEWCTNLYVDTDDESCIVTFYPSPNGWTPGKAMWTYESLDI